MDVRESEITCPLCGALATVRYSAGLLEGQPAGVVDHDDDPGAVCLSGCHDDRTEEFREAVTTLLRGA
ncbi:hypothetical protein [Solicola sp. PLA-1-18]|uniref:hypothetical protein n=1 Tax=Solicola sp. PLA-1-18 TaxID=3380532 RepID=UPI003B7AB64D